MKRFSIHPRKPGTYLVIIFLTACFLRIIFLGQVPAAFHIDEIMNGYVGRFSDSIRIDRIGNIRLLDEACPTKLTEFEPAKTKTLYINSGPCEMSDREKNGFTEIDRIVRQNSTTAYSILVPKESPL